MTSSPHVQKQCWEEQKEREVDDALRVCMLNLLPVVSTLPNLVDISLVNMKIYIFQTIA